MDGMDMAIDGANEDDKGMYGKMDKGMCCWFLFVSFGADGRMEKLGEWRW